MSRSAQYFAADSGPISGLLHDAARSSYNSRQFSASRKFWPADSERIFPKPSCGFCRTRRRNFDPVFIQRARIDLIGGFLEGFRQGALPAEYVARNCRERIGQDFSAMFPVREILRLFVLQALKAANSSCQLLSPFR